MGNRTPALLRWFDWHHRCVPGQWESGGIPHLFGKSVTPYKQRLMGSSWQQQQQQQGLPPTTTTTATTSDITSGDIRQVCWALEHFPAKLRTFSACWRRFLARYAGMSNDPSDTQTDELTDTPQAHIQIVIRLVTFNCVTASCLEQAAELLCTQANSASYPQPEREMSRRVKA